MIIIINYIWNKWNSTIWNSSSEECLVNDFELPYSEETCSTIASKFVCLHKWSFLKNKNNNNLVVVKHVLLKAMEILRSTSYGDPDRAETGIERLLSEEYFTAAYPLHDVITFLLIWWRINWPKPAQLSDCSAN